MDNGHCTKGAYHIEIGHSLPGQTLTHSSVLNSCWSTRSILDVVVNGGSVCIDSPQGGTHVGQVLVRTVECEGQIGWATHVVVARHDLTNLEETTHEVVPRWVVQIVDTSTALGISGIVVRGVKSVFGGSVEVVIARWQRQAHQGNICYWFDII